MHDVGLGWDCGLWSLIATCYVQVSVYGETYLNGDFIEFEDEFVVGRIDIELMDGSDSIDQWVVPASSLCRFQEAWIKFKKEEEGWNEEKEIVTPFVGAKTLWEALPYIFGGDQKFQTWKKSLEGGSPAEEKENIRGDGAVG